MSEALYDKLFEEAYRARRKFPDPSHLLTALMEEDGELARAFLDEPRANIRLEAIQVAAVAIWIATEGDPALDELRRKRSLD